MIVPMKKATILMQSKDSAEAIEGLRALGVLHVEHERPPKDKDLGMLREDIALIDAATAVLSQEEFSLGKLPPDDKELTDWKLIARHVLDGRNRLNQLKDYALTLNNRINQWQRWGDFTPEAILALRDKGIYIRLYQIPVKEIKNLPALAKDKQAGLPAQNKNKQAGLPAQVIPTPHLPRHAKASRRGKTTGLPVGCFIVKKISTLGGIANCAVITRQEIDIPFKEVALPKMGLMKMQARLSENNQIMQIIKDDIQKAASNRASLMRIRSSLEEEWEFQQALSGMGQSGKLMYLMGYIPYDAVDSFKENARRQSWGIMIREPSAEDKVPTLIRNPRWVSIINPVLKLLEVIPGYKEFDISLWFLVFFSIFFGMLIGDAGIGLIFLILTLLAQRKWAKRLSDRSLFVLLYISSACAVIWGMLTGTFFGQEWLPQTLRPLMPALRNDKYIQTLCFFIGAFHLSIAHSWRAVIKLPSFSALAEVGWILILWGAFFLARVLVLGDVFPVFGKWFFILGPALVIFFTNPSRNLFKGIGVGFGSLLLNLVNSFTDVVSYIRLFAVGLATVAVADAFNKMAMDVGFDGIVTGILTSFILLLGHTLNVVLGPMSILVHGVRLNVLEFCSHLNMQWSGFAYKPLRKK